MMDDKLALFAELLPTIRLATLRTLLQFSDIVDADAVELVKSELRQRGNEIIKQRFKP